MAALDREVFASLQFLLKAPSKNVVRQLCQECFSSSGIISEKLTESTCSNLSVTPIEANQLIQSLHNLTRHIVYHGLTSQEEILSLFPEGFHQNLKNLVTKILLENVATWRNEAQASQSVALGTCSNQPSVPFSAKYLIMQVYSYYHTLDQIHKHISLPRLVDMDWRVDIKTSSDNISKMAIPTCLLQLKIQEDAGLCGNDFATSALTVELNKQTLDTMLDGLGRIRDQLSTIANK
ncbi:COMM domain-containing protein 9 isoform X1 [Thamnophis elegans]|uniref:COMM domain-containing protein 9 isoform X1 n=1 Tax=Thamnophis elegans TaxID=35005 RepID=UPI0013790870|nr:COMM domain-containing protein 9 isoform X1 [Thamnophis elegans]